MWLKNLFIRNRAIQKKTNPLLRLEAIKLEKGYWILTFHQKGELTPLRISLEKILSNINLMKHIHPELLLCLSTLQDQMENKHKPVIMNAQLRNNKYEITYNDELKITMEGKNICKDIHLLKSMHIEDAFKVIYNTATYNATIRSNKSTKNDSQIKKSNNKDHPKPQLNIIKLPTTKRDNDHF